MYDHILGGDSDKAEPFESDKMSIYVGYRVSDSFNSYPSSNSNHSVFRGDHIYADMVDMKLHSCVLDELKFQPIMGAILLIKSCEFSSCVFKDCDFSAVYLQFVRFDRCRFVRCSFDSRTRFGRVSFERCSGMDELAGLGSVRILEPHDEHLEITPPIHTVPLGWQERYLSWERIRTVGRLPLFGLSAFALLGIPLFTWGIAVYNEQAMRFREWSQIHAAGIVDAPPLNQLVAKIHPIPLPDLTFWTLVATLLLGVGSVLFTFCCPSRMKEFSTDRWIDELRQHPARYLPLSWEHRNLRMAIALCYLSGGLVAIGILGVKIVSAAIYIIKNTIFPWYFW